MISGNDYIKQAYKNTQGFISKMYIDNNKLGTFTYHYTPDNLAKQPLVDEENLYISQNTFFRPVRNKDSLKRLNMLYVDLDCYKLGLHKEYVLELLSEEYFGRKIPRPTYIIDSGRGLYLLWSINEDKNAFPRWKRVQHYLHSTLKDLGSDGSVTEDVARVLRAPGSINSKTGTRVEVLNECNYTYTLYEIIKEYLPDNTPTYNPDKPTEKARTKKYGNVIRMATLSTLLYARIKDIEKLLLMREKAGNVNLRENCLFMYRYCCCHYYNDTAKALQMTLDLYNKLTDQSGYTQKSIARRTKSGEIYYLKKNRKFSNRKIIELLGITEEEQSQLSTLISKEHAKRRKSERNKKAYRKKLEAKGKNTKDEVIKLRKNEIKRLLAANKSMKDICTLLRISKTTYYRDLEVIRKEDSPVNEPKSPNKTSIKQRGTKTRRNECKSNKGDLEGNKLLKYCPNNKDSQKFSLCITKDVVLCLFQRKQLRFPLVPATFYPWPLGEP